jgi:DNA-binding CsgD family transcriptional regulator
LAAEGLRALVAHRINGRPEERLLSEVEAASGGNPLLAQAFLDDLALDSRASIVPGLLPQRGSSFAFTRAVRDLIAPERSPALDEVATVAAVLGEESSAERLARVVGLDQWALRRALADLDGMGLFAADVVLRSRVRDAVIEYADPQRLDALVLRAGEVLYEEGAAITVVAARLVSAGSVLGTWALDVLREAAETEFAGGDHRAATALLTHARDHCAAPGVAAEVSLRLLEIAWWAGTVSSSRLVNRSLDDARCGLLAPDSTGRLAQHLAWCGRDTEAAEALGLAADSAGGADADDVGLAASELWVRHLFPGLEPVLGPEEAVGPALSATAARAPWLPDALTLPRLVAAGDTEQVAVHATAVLQHISAAPSDLEALHMALFSLLAVERLDSAAVQFARVAGAARRDWPARFRSVVEAFDASFWLQRGDPEEAISCASRSLRLLGDGQECVPAMLARAVLLMAMTECGRHEEVAQYLATPMRPVLLRTPYGLLWLRARGRHHLAMGATRAAIADFRSCQEILKSWGMELPGLVPWRNDLAEALLAAGRREQAAQYAEEQLAVGGECDTRSRGVALRWAAIAGPGERRQTLLKRSSDVLHRSGDCRELARTLDGLARTHSEDDGLANGRAIRRRSDALVRNCAASRARLRARTSAETDASPAQTALLSEAERKVARLAGKGMTNREIAKTLFVTMSTVEQHLTRVYRKLSVTRRGQLSDLVEVL